MRERLCRWIVNLLKSREYKVLDMGEYHGLVSRVRKTEGKVIELEKKLDELHAVEGRIAESAEMSAQQQKEMTEIINEYLFGDE